MENLNNGGNSMGRPDDEAVTDVAKRVDKGSETVRPNKENHKIVLYWIIFSLIIFLLVSGSVFFGVAATVNRDGSLDLSEVSSISVAVFGILVASLTLNVAIATLVPYFMSIYQVRKEASEIFESRISNQMKEFRDKFDSMKLESDKAISRIDNSIVETMDKMYNTNISRFDELSKSNSDSIRYLEQNSIKRIEDFEEKYEIKMGKEVIASIREGVKTDAHLSRMIGFVLTSNGQLIWGIGWLSRSLKRYVKIPQINPTYSEFIDMNLYFISKSIEKIIGYSKYKKILESENLESADLDEIKEYVRNNIHAGNGEGYRTAIRACKDLSDFIIYIDDFAMANSGKFKESDMKAILSPFVGILFRTILENDDRYATGSSNGLLALETAIRVIERSEGRAASFASENAKDDFLVIYKRLLRGLMVARGRGILEDDAIS